MSMLADANCAKPSDVGDQMQRIGKAAETLMDRVLQVKSRISSVLRVEGNISVQKDATLPETPVVPLAQDIRTIRYTIEDCIGTLEEIRDSCEL